MTVQNNWLYGCMRCVIYGASQNVSMLGSYNISAINTSGLVVINSSGQVYDNRYNGWTINKDGRVLKNGWTELNSTNAIALSPYTLNGNAGNKYKVKADTSDRYAVLDVFALNGESVNFKFTNATYSLILSTQTNVETIDGNALPFTISGSLYDNYVISSDGANFWIL